MYILISTTKLQVPRFDILGIKNFPKMLRAGETRLRKRGTTNQTAGPKSLDYTADFLACVFLVIPATDAKGNKIYTTKIYRI